MCDDFASYDISVLNFCHFVNTDRIKIKLKMKEVVDGHAQRSCTSVKLLI